jgi:hypothetical protein
MDLSIDELFTRDSLLTLQGGAAAAWIVPTVIDHIFLGRVPKMILGLLSLGIALGLSIYSATLADEQGLQTWIVAVLNGFLIAFTALGLNKTSERVFGGKPESTAVPQPAPAYQPATATPGAAGAPAAPGGLTFGGSDQADRAASPAKASKRPAGFTRGWL